MSTEAQVADQAGVIRATTLFKATFHTDPTHAVAAPGRVNLIGEHVDYNDGFVFPLALEKSTYMVGSLQPDDTPFCEVVAEAFPGQVAKFLPNDTPADATSYKWSRYLKGMAALYSRNGSATPAFRAAVVSDVPLGAGLSSSAALEMATGIFIEQLSGNTIASSERALLGQRCEHDFAGVKCGIMDQLISSCGKQGCALLIDCRSHETTDVMLADEGVKIVVADSRKTHELAGSEYGDRQRQCKEAMSVMAKQFPEKKISELRDCNEEMLKSVKNLLDEKTLMRATHVILEDVRTLKARAHMEKGEWKEVGKLMYESHESLQKLYEVSTEEIDGMVEIARRVDGVYGSRITGGGFGGCTVSLVKTEAVADLMKAFEEKYPPISGGVEATVFATRAGDGARNISHLLQV